MLKGFFTLSDIKEELLKEAHKLHDENPIVSRIYVRSLDLIDNVISELVDLGLLVKENNIFRGTGDFIHFYCLLRDNIRGKLKRFIGWAVFYLYHFKGLRSFSIRELVNLISHSDEEYLRELPYLMKCEDGKWLRVLERHGDKWRIVQKPYRSMKPILLTYMNDRLQAAILELSKKVDEFTEYQIVEKLRYLECNCAERVLAKIGLKKKDEIWHIDESAIKEIEELILFGPIKMEWSWPLFGIRPTVNPYFKIEGAAHNAYVDMPNSLIGQFLDGLYDLSEIYGDDLERLYIEANKLKDKYNELFKQHFGGWLSIIVRRESSARRPFGIQVKVDWNLFQEFLKELAESEDISLEEKYEYLSMCRFDIAWMLREPSEELVKKRVKLMARSSIEEINDILTTFIKDLLERRGKYRRKLLLEKGFHSLTLSYLPEVILTFCVIGNCINEGAISTCYREMRKILESLSWVIIDDILLFRKGETICEKIIFPPLRIPSKRWYDWARSNGLIIRSLNEWEKPLGILIQKISEKYNLHENEVEELLFDNISYPLFLISARTEKIPPDDLKDILLYNAKSIKPLIEENIKRIVSQIVKRPLYESDEEFIVNLTDRLLADDEHFSIRYPSNSFIIQLLEKISKFKLKISSSYGRYSYFVHSYDKTWQFYPFSSVVEFEIFKHELDRFIKLLRGMFDFYEKEMLLKREM